MVASEEHLHDSPISSIDCACLLYTLDTHGITYLKVGAISIDRSQEIPERAHN
ncbi:MAG: hypothetical protein ACXVDN_20315 [Ktedonobacteraceae bacterium]